MAATLISNINISLSFIFNNTVGAVAGEFKPAFTNKRTQNNGTSKDQNDLLWWDGATSSTPRSLAASSTENIDLAGALSDAFGTTLTVVKLVGIYIVVYTTETTASLKIGGHATQAVELFDNDTDILELGPDADWYVNQPGANGWCTIAAGSSDQLKIENADSAAQCNYGIAIWGRSA